MPHDINSTPQYSPAFFSEGYYGKGERSGFTEYSYSSPEQKRQLALKWDFCSHIKHDNVLFVGCARGFEVAHWWKLNRIAYGVDVSEWAIQKQIPLAKGLCKLYNGHSLNFQEDELELLASFDVLTVIPEDMFQKLAAEMVRVAKNGIVFRVYVKNWRNLCNAVDGEDGATFKLRHFWEYDKAFGQSGKFKLDFMKMHGQYEVTAVYKRV